MKIKTQFSHYGKLSHSFYEEINMYQIDFHKPLHIHFIGIGGISMSGLAEILLGEEFKVSGSDAKESPLTDSLTKKGARIFYGQRASNITDAPLATRRRSALYCWCCR